MRANNKRIDTDYLGENFITQFPYLSTIEKTSTNKASKPSYLR